MGEYILLEELIPTEQLRTGRLVVMKVEGSAMEAAGIYDGDFALVSLEATFDAGDLVIVPHEDEVAIRRVLVEEGHMRLQSLDLSRSYIPEEGELIIGKVTAIVRTF